MLRFIFLGACIRIDNEKSPDGVAKLNHFLVYICIAPLPRVNISGQSFLISVSNSTANYVFKSTNPTFRDIRSTLGGHVEFFMCIEACSRDWWREAQAPHPVGNSGEVLAGGPIVSLRY